jgi:hypothetical protein
MPDPTQQLAAALQEGGGLVAIPVDPEDDEAGVTLAVELAQDAQHGARGAGTTEAPLHAVATEGAPGFMSAAQVTSLIAALAAATANANAAADALTAANAAGSLAASAASAAATAQSTANAKPSVAYVDAGSFRTPIPRLPRLFSQGPTQVNAGANFDIAGPAAGYLRVIVNIKSTSLGATATFDTILDPGLPSEIYVSRGLAGGTSSTAATLSLSPGATNVMVIGYGETLRFANVGSSASRVFASYYDMPANGITLIRAQITGTAPVTLIPAAPADHYWRLLSLFRYATGGAGTGGSNALVLHTHGFVFQDDSATVRVDYSLGAGLLGRVSMASSGTPAFFLESISDQCTDLAVTAALGAAMTSRSVKIFGAYETIPIAA